MRQHDDFQITFSLIRQMIDFCHNTNCITDLVGQIFQELFHIVNTDHIPVVIHTNVNLSALSVSKATDPVQVFVSPGFFPFNILPFDHHRTTFVTSIYSIP